MEFNNKNISLLAYSNGFTLWHYKADNDLEVIKSEGYFNNCHVFFKEGDMIIISHPSAILTVKSIKDEKVSVTRLYGENND